MRSRREISTTKRFAKNSICENSNRLLTSATCDVRGEIAHQSFRGCFPIDEAYVAVGPDEVNCVPEESGFVCGALPGELVQLNVRALANSWDFGFDVAIN